MDRVLTAPAVMTSKETDPDIALIERYTSGDMTAFDELMIRYERQIYRLCYRFTSNTDDARDLAQEVFIKAFEHLARLQEGIEPEDLALPDCDESLHQSCEVQYPAVRRSDGDGAPDLGDSAD